ncbi:peptidase C13 family-domain-containing protein [Mycena crocata]|nr:peptidase C13 family-domain-containing protein [Mycena crocata]
MLVSCPHLLQVLFLFSWSWGILAATPSNEEIVGDFFNKNGSTSGSTSAHTNNWAVLVCSSRYWFNYRHMANALGMYRTVKRLGIPDSNIILMLADDAACNARNKFPGSVYANPGRGLDLYGDNIEVDYRGYEVTVENFIRVLTGRMEPSVPRSKRLLTDASSNIFVYMTGHGGNEFLKFQDNEEISAFDIADAFEQMWQKKRYNEIFFMIDTCQANTLYSKFYSPNILATGSSKIDQSSYSYENDNDIGVAVIDRYTHYILEYMERINKTSHQTMQDLFDSYDPVKIHSEPGVRSDLFPRPLDEVRITDFFGGVAQVEMQDASGRSPPPASASVFDDTADGSGQNTPKTHQQSARPKSASSTPPPTVGDSWRGTRAWGGVVLLGVLVGWVFWGKGV